MVKIIAGLMGSSVASGSAKMASAEQMRTFFHMLQRHQVNELDTARVYNAGRSEEMLGQIPEAKDGFAIGTKAPGFSPGTLTYQKIINACNASLAALKQDKIDLYYFHGPDRQTPLEESCKAIAQLHKEGKITRFGVSNFTAEEVQEIHAICSKNEWITPSVYQGGYNPFGRVCEEKLFPTLRKLDMSFYAYSPLAGGYFSRSTDELRNPPSGGRMDQMPFFKTMYVTDVSLKLHEDLATTCEKERMTMKEATLRWLMHHSILGKEDGVVLGASSESQMEENLKACEAGPLPQNVASAIDGLFVPFSDGRELPYCV